MAKKKNKAEDRHKPRRMFGIPVAIATQLDKLAERRATRATHELIRAARELLEREGLWPPSPTKENP